MKEKAFHINELKNRQRPTMADSAVHIFSWKLKYSSRLRAPDERLCKFTGGNYATYILLACLPLATYLCPSGNRCLLTGSQVQCRTIVNNTILNTRHWLRQ